MGSIFGGGPVQDLNLLATYQLALRSPTNVRIRRTHQRPLPKRLAGIGSQQDRCRSSVLVSGGKEHQKKPPCRESGDTLGADGMDYRATMTGCQ